MEARPPEDLGPERKIMYYKLGKFLTPLMLKIIGGVSITALIYTGYYHWHVKPIKDLTNSNKVKTEILDKTKVEVQESNKDSEHFEDKWKTAKELIYISEKIPQDITNDIVETTPKEDTNENNKRTIDFSTGEHSITL